MKRNSGGIKLKARHIVTYMVTSAVLLLFSTQTIWADGFGMDGNQITITTSTASYTPSVDGGGAISTVSGITGEIEEMSFTLVKQNVANATYTDVDLGLIIYDVNNSRRIEAALLGISVEVGTSTLNVTIPAGQNIQLVASNGDGSTIFQAQLANADDDSIVEASGSLVQIDFTNLISKIEEKFSQQSGSAAALNDIIAIGSYEYQIFIKSPSVPIGTVSGAVVTPFTSATDIGTGYAASGYADASIEAFLTSEAGGSPTDDDLSPISNPSYLYGTCYILSGAFDISGDSMTHNLITTATTNLNVIGFIYKGTGLTTAHDLGTAVGNCDLVSKWDPTTQALSSHSMAFPTLNNFNLELGSFYFVSVTADHAYTLSGIIPSPPTINLITTATTNLSGIALPNSKSGLTTAHDLGTDIGGEVDLVSKWDPVNQALSSHSMAFPTLNNFAIEVGQGYYISVTSDTTWDW